MLVVHVSCMGKTITIDDQAYELLSSLKQGRRDSFSQVIHRNIARKANTCGELEEAYQNEAPPNIDLAVLDRVIKERGRRSGAQAPSSRPRRRSPPCCSPPQRSCPAPSVLSQPPLPLSPLPAVPRMPCCICWPSRGKPGCG